LKAESQIVIVPGATHLVEPGALDQVVDQAARWFLHHLAGAEGGIDVQGQA